MFGLLHLCMALFYKPLQKDPSFYTYSISYDMLGYDVLGILCLYYAPLTNHNSNISLKHFQNFFFAEGSAFLHMIRDMRFPTMWYVHTRRLIRAFASRLNIL